MSHTPFLGNMRIAVKNVACPETSSSQVYKHPVISLCTFSDSPDTKSGLKHTQSYSPSSSLAVPSWNPATAFPFPLLLVLTPFGPSSSTSRASIP